MFAGHINVLGGQHVAHGTDVAQACSMPNMFGDFFIFLGFPQNGNVIKHSRSCVLNFFLFVFMEEEKSNESTSFISDICCILRLFFWLLLKKLLHTKKHYLTFIHVVVVVVVVIETNVGNFTTNYFTENILRSNSRRSNLNYVKQKRSNC